ncbi:MAG: hypothetical protein HZB71_10755 [Betaproteobacteria bacterium]|nr:hypothetical protein [Betaproteobacteria bacterium]
MNVRFLAEADIEFREAARYYEDKAPGLGSPVDDELRKFVLRRFPYNLIYAVAGDEVVITAVAHHKRRPFYWGRRGRR